MTVRGHFPAQNVVVGSWVSFEAKWVSHAQYGRQMTVTRSPVSVKTWTDDRVLSALSANQVGPQLRLQLQLYAKGAGLTLAASVSHAACPLPSWAQRQHFTGSLDCSW